MVADGGAASIGGDLNVEATATGGSGTSGGEAYGGDAELSLYGPSSLTADGFTSVNSDALGGNGSNGGYGGDGNGGDSSLLVGGGSVNLANASISANGTGGDGQSGGSGYGGYASIGGDDGTIDLGAFTSVSARGTGGNASVGFGGQGGRPRRLRIDRGASQSDYRGLLARGTITGGDALVDASGTGGTGGAGYVDPENSENNIAAGSGGYGYGGADCDCNFYGGAFVTAQVDGATIDLGNVTIVSDGTGGVGGAGASGQNGGIGGNGYGGDVVLDWSIRIKAARPPAASTS